ncbi:hypothetical protein M0R45_034620 [Rubus argutus]|uniref:Uncharacterized protein n=1 Tax=Rubus argutus TaxID=59490 RepID=A0AAW1VRN4_RUBAR
MSEIEDIDLFCIYTINSNFSSFAVAGRGDRREARAWCGQERRRRSRDEHGLGFGFIAGGDVIKGSEAATRGRGHGLGEAWA